MKTFSDAALEALERGDAIVSASVEIIPSRLISYSTVDTVDIDSEINGSTTLAGGLTAGITVGGFDPTDIMRMSLPSGQTYTAWMPRGDLGWHNEFDVIKDADAAGSRRIYDSGNVASSITHGGGYSTAAAARSAFVRHTMTGASSYTFFFYDDPLTDNTGGVSILVEKGVVSSGAGDPIRLWGGYGEIELPSDEGTSTFQGIGDRGLIQSSSGALGGSAQNTTLALSGIEPAAIEVLDANEIRDASVVVRRLIFDSAGKTLLGSYVFTRGRLDELKTAETVGAGAAIQLNVEGAARGLGRRGARLRSDADHRLVNPDDGFFKFVSYAMKKTLYWGGKKPSTFG